MTDNAIVIRHAREHNLKNIDLSIPRDRFSVITGVSGSGKSTIAFDILFAEGQRRYLESLNAYARQFVQPARRPDVDGVYGVPPTVAIEQRTSRGGRKSTVATLTEIYPFLRLLFVKLGVQHCPDCGVPIQPQTPDAIAARVLRDYRGKRVTRSRAPGHRAQGLLHGPRGVGRGQGLRAPARGRRPSSHGSLAAPGSVQGAHPRASGGNRDRLRGKGARAPRAALARPGLRQGRDPHRRCRSARRYRGNGAKPRPARRHAAPEGDRLLHAARLPELRKELRGAGPAPLLLQLEARVVPRLLRHGRCSSPASTPSRREKRSGGTTGGEDPRRPARAARASACGPRPSR